MRTSVVFEGPSGLAVQTPTVRFVGAAGEDVVTTARDEVAGGADRVELCGALGPVPHAAVRAAVWDAVGDAVGAVMYGFESLEATVAFKQRFAAGESPRGAFLYAGEGERVDRRGDLGTSFVPVAGVEDAAATASALVDEGVTLLELYAGLGPEVAAAVATAVAGRASVGLALYPG